MVTRVFHVSSVLSMCVPPRLQYHHHHAGPSSESVSSCGFLLLTILWVYATFLYFYGKVELQWEINGFRCPIDIELHLKICSMANKWQCKLLRHVGMIQAIM